MRFSEGREDSDLRHSEFLRMEKRHRIPQGVHLALRRLTPRMAEDASCDRKQPATDVWSFLTAVSGGKGSALSRLCPGCPAEDLPLSGKATSPWEIPVSAALVNRQTKKDPLASSHNLLTTISPTIHQSLSNPAPTIGNLNPSTTTPQQREMGAIQFVIRWPKTIAQSAYFAMTTSSQTTPSRESDVPGARAKVALSSARPSTWRM